MRLATLKTLLVLLVVIVVVVVLTRKPPEDEYLVTALQGTAQVQSRVSHDLGVHLPPDGQETATRRELAKKSAWHPLQVGDSLHPGDTVRTGPDSWVDLLPTGGMGLRVTAVSVLRLTKQSTDDHAVMEVSLESGRCLLRVLVKKLYGQRGYRAGTEMLRVETPVATAGIRGTAFAVDYEPGTEQATVAVMEGTVNVRSRLAPGTGVNVTAGRKTSLTKESRSPALLPLTAEDREALAEIEQIKVNLSLGDKINRGLNLRRQAIDPTFNRIVTRIAEYEMHIFQRSIVIYAPLRWDGKVPPTLQAVPLQEDSDYLDPWETEYHYEVLAPKTAVIISAGPDRRLHTPDDVVLKVQL